MKNKKIIALDLDGTTLNSVGLMTEEVKTALKRARDEGHIVCFVTGRSEAELLSLKDACELTDYIILNNGGKIIRNKDKKVIKEYFLPEKDVLDILGKCRNKNCFVYMASGAEWYVNTYNERVTNYEKEIQNKAVCFRETRELPLDCIESLSVVGEVREVEDYVRRKKHLRVVASEKECIDILNANVNKWTGLKIVMKSLGYTREQVMAVGDYDNDIEMIQNAGTGVAVANARQCVKRVADYVTVNDHNAHAVAEAVYEFVLKK